MEGNSDECNQLPAGRYEFKDSGIYIGEWLNEKAVGIGLLTKDKSQGEFTGLWNCGSEKCGVFLWPSAPGAMYEGEWANSKRHGFGVFVKEDWIVMGKFQEGFITLGVKTKEKAVGKFEGEFEDGCPVFGMETYADGGTYCGEYKSGLREGYGVRSSIPYGDIFAFLPEEKHSVVKPNFDDDNTALSNNHIDKNGSTTKLPNKFKCGFVLSGKKSDLLIKKLRHISACKKHQKQLQRSKSLTSIFSARKKKDLYNLKKTAGGMSLHSTPGNVSPKSCHSSMTFHTIMSVATLDLTLNDTIAADVTETYSGQWVQDQRHGFGVTERSDGVVYEGSWLNNKRHGFGITKFGDGSFEEGQYQNGKLIYLWTKRNPFMFLYSFRMSLHIRKSVNLAREAALKAKEKDNDCRRKLSEIRDVVKKAKDAAALAREYSLETRQLVREMYPDYEQPGIKCLGDIVRMMRVTKRGQKAFETMLQSAIDVVEDRGVPDVEKEAKGVTPYDKDFLLVDSKGEHRASRHGSFRRSKRIPSQNCVEEAKIVGKQSNAINAPLKLQAHSKFKLEKAKLKTLPIIKPQIVPAIEIEQIKVTVEGLSMEILEIEQNNNFEEPENEDTYFTITDIVATSKIPREKLSDILTPDSLEDHFNHYGHSSPTPSDVSNKNTKSQSRSISTSSSYSNLNSPRRFTVPEIMPEQPVSPSHMSNVLSDLNEEPEEDKAEESKVIYITQNCNRKRAYPIPSNTVMTRRASKVTLNPPQDELTPLPVKFNFQSQANLRKDLKEGSLPDVSVARLRDGISREESTKLIEEHRQALERDNELMKQGVFVIRLYKIWDWLRKHSLSLMVIIINICLLYIFMIISKDYNIS